MPLQLLKAGACGWIAPAPFEMHLRGLLGPCSGQAWSMNPACWGQSFGCSPPLCAQGKGGFMVNGIKGHHLFIGQRWEACLQGA